MSGDSILKTLGQEIELGPHWWKSILQYLVRNDALLPSKEEHARSNERKHSKERIQRSLQRPEEKGRWRFWGFFCV